jgi:transcriptional regulator with XRE-family HTH domain
MKAYSRHEVARAFGATLRETRRERGVSQDALAERCDFNRCYPSLLERGLRQPTLAMLLRLAGALEIQPERLVTETVGRLQEPANTATRA